MPPRPPVAPDGLPQMRRVKSTNLFAIGFDEETRTLYVQFRDHAAKRPAPGTLYKYKDVHYGTWRRFQVAASFGKYLIRHIRDKYWCAKWTGRSWRGEVALSKDTERRRRKRALLALAKKLRRVSG